MSSKMGELSATRMERPPTTIQYYTQFLSKALIAETAFRYLGFAGSSLKDDSEVDTISFKAIDNLTGNILTSWIPFASAKEVEAAASQVLQQENEVPVPVPEEVVSEGATIPNEAAGSDQAGYFDGITNTVYQGYETFTTGTGNFCDRGIEILDQNSDWLATTASIAIVSASVNHLSSRYIKNAYVRNALSLGTGVAVTWAGAQYGLGYELSFSKAADIGLRITTFHTIAKIVAPIGNWLISSAPNPLDYAKMPLAFPAKLSKVKTN